MDMYATFWLNIQADLTAVPGYVLAYELRSKKVHNLSFGQADR